MASEEFDVVVIGAGPVGENVADRAAQGGLSVVIVESELVGGECSYWACVPSKALLRPIAAHAAALRVEGARQAITGALDIAAIFARRNRFTGDWHDGGQVSWLEGAKIALHRGHGRLAGDRSVEVTAPDGVVTTLRARHAAVLAVGTAAAIPGIPGLAEAGPWTSREATAAQTVPGSLAIIGGGVVACEMATAYQAFGSTVTMLVRDDRLLPNVDGFAAEAVLVGLKEAGVDVRLGATTSAVERLSSGKVQLQLGGNRTIETDEVLVATGRTPRTTDLGLETIGLEPGTWVESDSTGAVTRVGDEPWLYSVGDVNHRALLTHMGKYQARACGDAIVARATGKPLHDGPWGAHASTSDQRAITQVIFTDPEIAAVGLTTAQAERAGLTVRAVDYEIGNVSGASLHADGYKGTARMVVDVDREVIVGATFVGQDVSDLLHAATIAVVGEVPLKRLWHAVPAFPTMSEIWLRLLETYGL